MLAKADVVSIVNWTMIPKMTSILVEIVDRIMPNLPPRDTRNFFFDLTDPAKRSAEDIREVLRVISRFQAHSEVTLGLNFNEALQVSETLGLDKGDRNEDSLKEMATQIRRKLKLPALSFTPSSQPPAQPKTELGGAKALTPKTQKSQPAPATISMRASHRPGFAVSLRSRPLPWRPAPQALRPYAQSPSASQTVELLKRSGEASS